MQIEQIVKFIEIGTQAISRGEYVAAIGHLVSPSDELGVQVRLTHEGNIRRKFYGADDKTSWLIRADEAADSIARSCSAREWPTLNLVAQVNWLADAPKTSRDRFLFDHALIALEEWCHGLSGVKNEFLSDYARNNSFDSLKKGPFDGAWLNEWDIAFYFAQLFEERMASTAFIRRYDRDRALRDAGVRFPR